MNSAIHQLMQASVTVMKEEVERSIKFMKSNLVPQELILSLGQLPITKLTATPLSGAVSPVFVDGRLFVLEKDAMVFHCIKIATNQAKLAETMGRTKTNISDTTWAAKVNPAVA
ncbi:UNVERIFIED_CONTAM: hypothetical protein HDU68_000283 [Siphonaria sp. JEL0065]|nr:hypothetical protein HDU68_000283 [Siphonaria sp. JEL0065]